MRPIHLALALSLALTACSKADKAPADTMTRRQKDSALGTSVIPGAKGITGALGAADSMNAHNAQLDSMNHTQ